MQFKYIFTTVTFFVVVAWDLMACCGGLLLDYSYGQASVAVQI